ncbi:hypothetical protein [Nitrococcus mobilis]|uniref:Uncharacterized protein n=1 Tax=Nitrococcus mobilis Nb-231 TaxID=314278 RepID=A4BQD0_9GAMM|nr:hypothetical protein [Nitrococcus mobilis]EAR22285.1 hypothetical protein NB231_05230 [Nitrococcus mobilis Nb-231]
MKLVFLETPLFTRLLGDYLTDENYRELQRALMENPEMGDVMPALVDFAKFVGKTHVVAKANEVD